MGAYDTTIGALLIGVITNTYLFGLVSYQYGHYLNSNYNDHLWVRLMVMALFSVDIVHTASVIYLFWRYGVENFMQPEAILNNYWPYPFTALVTVCTAYLVQSFFTFRIWKLTYNRVLTGFVFAVASGTFVLGVGTSIKVWNLELISDLMLYRPLYASWLSMEVTIDAIIAAIMVYKLSQSKTGFKNSDHAINRLIRLTVQSGACAGVFAIFGPDLLFHKSENALLCNVWNTNQPRLFEYFHGHPLIPEQSTRSAIQQDCREFTSIDFRFWASS
ncbi:hypothetical protein NP233_g5757 [Leucocoprinus birnbaumii]|uniref:DUF6534 domain-containing protein n=1 Tax=Leucocoprinus birnbaumii TaxID=56174 RepID=A0AAD5VYD6_9AGAR|nr:hypothetical protein NP233_g5757 [Leucocoprinus birnbaumii]